MCRQRHSRISATSRNPLYLALPFTALPFSSSAPQILLPIPQRRHHNRGSRARNAGHDPLPSASPKSRTTPREGGGRAGRRGQKSATNRAAAPTSRRSIGGSSRIHDQPLRRPPHQASPTRTNHSRCHSKAKKRAPAATPPGLEEDGQSGRSSSCSTGSEG